MNKSEKKLLCPFCKDSTVVTLTPFQVTLFHLGFIFIAPDIYAFCPKCERRIVEVGDKLFIELEVPNGYK